MAQAANGDGLLEFGGRLRSVPSIFLLYNGISFAIQAALFLVLGGCADFGSWRPYILIAATIVGVALGFVPLRVNTPDQWQAAFWLAVFSLIAFNLAWNFYLATFPLLARNTPEIRAAMRDFMAGRVSREHFDRTDSMKRNELSNMSLWVNSIGTVSILLLGNGILFGQHANDTTNNSMWVSDFVLCELLS